MKTRILITATALALLAGCQSGGQQGSAQVGGGAAALQNCVAYDQNGNPYRVACP
ncbi:lipoprotein [Roseibium sp. Sym1]|uniref:lipoprotein n=1 Tax=Roseibium sp. Sym1 TaxID=3016006 RepID=UPI0022B2C806|nr:lipoprotein [Roseibium sp. Sym1]